MCFLAFYLYFFSNVEQKWILLIFWHLTARIDTFPFSKIFEIYISWLIFLSFINLNDNQEYYWESQQNTRKINSYGVKCLDLRFTIWLWHIIFIYIWIIWIITTSLTISISSIDLSVSSITFTAFYVVCCLMVLIPLCVCPFSFILLPSTSCFHG